MTVAPHAHVYLTTQEAADRARVSERTIRRAIRDGKLEAGAANGRWRIRPESIDRWLEGDHQEDGA